MFWRVNDFKIAPQNQIITLAIDSDIMEIISTKRQLSGKVLNASNAN